MNLKNFERLAFLQNLQGHVFNIERKLQEYSRIATAEIQSGNSDSHKRQMAEYHAGVCDRYLVLLRSQMENVKADTRG